jgi:hypothetical protein
MSLGGSSSGSGSILVRGDSEFDGDALMASCGGVFVLCSVSGCRMPALCHDRTVERVPQVCVVIGGCFIVCLPRPFLDLGLCVCARGATPGGTWALWASVCVCVCGGGGAFTGAGLDAMEGDGSSIGTAALAVSVAGGAAAASEVPLAEDGTLSMFWLDAYEDPSATGQFQGALYLFGKVWQG